MKGPAATAKLKVYRTPIGFHDAYVAASSQKAALEAWGSDHDLFARGAAEIVTDEALTAGPLSTPGVVVKRLRGSAAEQIAALPPDRPRRGGETPEKPPSAAKARPKRVTMPSRSALEAAEQALSDAEARQRAERDALAEEEAELTRRRRALEKKHADEIAKLERARAKAAAAYAAAVPRAGA